MNWMVVIGVLCLALPVGALIGLYVDELGGSSVKVRRNALTVLGGVALGTSLLVLLHSLGPVGASVREYWFYPVGLMIGLVGRIAEDGLKVRSWVVAFRRREFSPTGMLGEAQPSSDRPEHELSRG